MKKALINFFGIPLFLYLFVADRIMMRIMPFLTNKWHVNKAMHHDKQWIWILSGYRVLMFFILIFTYKLLQYVINQIF